MDGKTANKSYESFFPQNQVGFSRVRLDTPHATFKILAHEARMRQFIAGHKFRPIHIRMGITNACNMKCSFCKFRAESEKEFYDLFSYTDIIPEEKCIEIIRDFSEQEGKAITFCGSGECTTHKGYTNICYTAHDLGLQLGLITNGTRICKEEIANCIAETHSWIRIGLNAGTSSTFASITCRSKELFDILLHSIGSLRDKAVHPEFRIGLNFVINLNNYTEIQLAARRAREAGAHYIHYCGEFFAGLGHEAIHPIFDIISSSLDRTSAKEETDDFEVAVPKLYRGPIYRTETIEGDFKKCYYSKFATAIGADGNLYPCPQVQLNSQYSLGNVGKDGYSAVLNVGKKAAWENTLRAGFCKSCLYRPENELLEQLKEGKLNLDEIMLTYNTNTDRMLHRDFC